MSVSKINNVFILVKPTYTSLHLSSIPSLCYPFTTQITQKRKQHDYGGRVYNDARQAKKCQLPPEARKCIEQIPP